MTTPSILTEARIASAIESAEPLSELRLYDAKVPGLLLWRRPSGKPRWYVFRLVEGKKKRVPVGALNTWPDVTLEQARKLGQRIVADLAAGGDPVADRAKKRALARGGAVPFSDAVKRHVAKMTERGRTGSHVAEVRRVCEMAIASGIKDLADPSAASKADAWLKFLDVSPLTRQRYRIHLIAVGKTAVRWWPADALPREPFLALTGRGAAMPAPPYFAPDEAVTLVSDVALARIDTGGPLWAFLLYTGCRWKEAAWSRWDRLDLDRCTFSIAAPDTAEHAAGARVKRNKSRTVSLQPELVELLRTWKRETPAGERFIFADHWRGQNHRWNVEAFRAHLSALEIELEGRRIHSLRHTHAILAVASGEDSLRLRLSMGHAGEEMAGHYASAAMRYRSLLAGWGGQFRLRDPVEAVRLNPSFANPSCPSTDACTVSP